LLNWKKAVFPTALVLLVATLIESPEPLILFNCAICHIAFTMVAHYGVGIPENDLTGDGLTVLVVKENRIRGCNGNL
jgi:hypothetical protein